MTTTIDSSAGRAPAQRSLALPVLLVWAVFVLSQSQLWFQPPQGAGRVDNDYLMRLVQVRDLLAGQGWFDLMQYRLGPEGTLMHWSRVVDAPLAGLILLFRQFLEPAAAEWAAMVVWPFLLALLLIWALAIAGRALGGYAAGIVAAGLALGVILQSNKFQPGAIDHHNLQMVLVAAAVAGLLTRHHGAWPLALAGVAGGVSLSVGVEAAPQIAALALAVAGLWAAEGAASDRRSFAFALSLGGTVLFLFLAATPASNRFYPSCDVNSVALVVPVLLGAAGLAALTRLGPSGTGARVAVIAVLGAIVVGVSAVMPGTCLSNPLDKLDPILKTGWLTSVSEAKDAFTFLSTLWPHFLGVFIAPLIALAICLVLAWRGVAGSALPLAVLIALSYAATIYQVRGLVTLGVVSVPALATGIAWSYQHYRRTRKSRHGFGALALMVASVPASWSVVTFIRAAVFYVIYVLILPPSPPAEGMADDADTQTPAVDLASLAPVPLDCFTEALFAELALLPPGRVSAHFDTGAAILRATHHTVLSAPYHRNQAGMIAQLQIADAPPDMAEALVRGYGVDYIVLCPLNRPAALPEQPGLFAALHYGRVPSWLRPMSSPGAMIPIYRVEPAPSS